MSITLVLAIMILSYLAGAIPTGYWLTKALTGIDIRQVGSGSTGTTNVLRTAGKKAAAVVFFIDIAKGYGPVWLSAYATNHHLIGGPNQLLAWLPPLSGLLALVGHSKSIFLGFKGGKSAATGLGTIMAMNLPAALCSFALFVLTIFVGRIVSIASMLSSISSVIFMYLFSGGHVPYVSYCAAGSIYIIIRHKANIRRILSGTEPKIGTKIETKIDQIKSENESSPTQPDNS